MKERIGIIGQAIKIERENLDWSPEDTVFHTVRAALASANMSLDEIDTVVQAGDDVMDGIAIQHVYTVEPAGSFLKDESKVERDGAWAVHYAIAKLLTGKFRTAMIVAQSKAVQCSQSAFSGMTADPFYLRPVGADSDSIAALQAQYYLQTGSVTEEDFARVAVKNRANGARNVERTMAGETGRFTPEDVLQADPIASPITELSRSRAGDGCVVLLLASQDFIQSKGLNAAYITGMGLSSDVYYPTFRELAKLPSVGYATQSACKMAGTSIADVQLFELHENYAHQELMLYEAIGLCAENQAAAFLKEGATARDGSRPVNVSGGVLSGQIIYASGLARMMEASLQLRGMAGDTQLQGVKRAFIHSQAGLAMQANIAYVLEA
ncbi:MAG: thiolase family protein [Leptospiraceae bacterium]|nr:thiolase family protein [Leptospiraceae bacterium]